MRHVPQRVVTGLFEQAVELVEQQALRLEHHTAGQRLQFMPHAAALLENLQVPASSDRPFERVELSEQVVAVAAMDRTQQAVCRAPQAFGRLLTLEAFLARQRIAE